MANMDCRGPSPTLAALSGGDASFFKSTQTCVSRMHQDKNRIMNSINMIQFTSFLNFEHKKCIYESIAGEENENVLNFSRKYLTYTLNNDVSIHYTFSNTNKIIPGAQ